MKDEIKFRPIPDSQVGTAFEAWHRSEEGQAFTEGRQRAEGLRFRCSAIRQEASGFEHSPGRTVFSQSSFNQPSIGKRLDLVRFSFKGKEVVMPVNEFLERMAATETVERHVREGGYGGNARGLQVDNANVRLTVYSEGVEAVAMVKKENSWGRRVSFTEAYQGNSALTVHESQVVRQQRTVIAGSFLAKYGVEAGTQRVICGIKFPFKPLK